MKSTWLLGMTRIRIYLTEWQRYLWLLFASVSPIILTHKEYRLEEGSCLHKWPQRMKGAGMLTYSKPRTPGTHPLLISLFGFVVSSQAVTSGAWRNRGHCLVRLPTQWPPGARTAVQWRVLPAGQLRDPLVEGSRQERVRQVHGCYGNGANMGRNTHVLQLPWGWVRKAELSTVEGRELVISLLQSSREASTCPTYFLCHLNLSLSSTHLKALGFPLD